MSEQLTLGCWKEPKNQNKPTIHELERRCNVAPQTTKALSGTTLAPYTMSVHNLLREESRNTH